MLKESVTKALDDAGLKYTDIEQAAVGYVYGIEFALVLDLRSQVIPLVVKEDFTE
jgi:hypothetical protein